MIIIRGIEGTKPGKSIQYQQLPGIDGDGFPIGGFRSVHTDAKPPQPITRKYVLFTPKAQD